MGIQEVWEGPGVEVQGDLAAVVDTVVILLHSVMPVAAVAAVAAAVVDTVVLVALVALVVLVVLVDNQVVVFG